MAGQTSFSAITEADFDNVLRTISASAKGRSFLAEYRRRGRPEETANLLQALARIESAIAEVREELKPERIADELRRIAMTLELAAEGAPADAEGDENARRMALVGRARLELAMLAGSLDDGPAVLSAEAGDQQAIEPEADADHLPEHEAIEDDLGLMD